MEEDDSMFTDVPLAVDCPCPDCNRNMSDAVCTGLDCNRTCRVSFVAARFTRSCWNCTQNMSGGGCSCSDCNRKHVGCCLFLLGLQDPVRTVTETYRMWFVVCSGIFVSGKDFIRSVSDVERLLSRVPVFSALNYIPSTLFVLIL